MKRSHHNQIIGTFIAVAALATGCSPITASISKQAGAKQVGTGTFGGSSSSRARVMNFNTRVVESDGVSEKALVASPQSLTFGLSAAQIEAFRDSGKAELEFNGSITPNGMTAVFEVELTQEEIKDAGLLDVTVATLQPKGENGWELKLSPALSSEETAALLDHLAQIRFEIIQQD